MSHLPSMNRWYARPVFFVTDLARSLQFYENLLDFQKTWHEADGQGTVCQVNRSDCEIILCQCADRKDKSRLFIELTKEGVAELLEQIAARAIPHKKTRWGYDVVQIDDPDGNELLIPLSP
jgi:catechol 2,3-dioxygenase-like lactoylglutathione lyase family enzyme